MMADEPLEMRPFTIDAQTQKTLDLLAWFDELRAKMLFTPLISAEEMRRMQSNDTGNVQRKLRVAMADDEGEEFDAYTVLERAVRACDAEGLSIGDGFRALAEMRRQRDETAAVVAQFFLDDMPLFMNEDGHSHCVFPTCSGGFEGHLLSYDGLVRAEYRNGKHMDVFYHSPTCPVVWAINQRRALGGNHE